MCVGHVVGREAKKEEYVRTPKEESPPQLNAHALVYHVGNVRIPPYAVPVHYLYANMIGRRCEIPQRLRIVFCFFSFLTAAWVKVASRHYVGVG
jgi:hypothetical protein